MPTIETTVEPLVTGDRLPRDEFMRRWEATPEVRNAELIGGIVYLPSPVSQEHGETDANAVLWLNTYAAHTLGCKVGSNSTWFMLRDAPQPDCHLRVLTDYGGNSWVEGKYLEGAPELVAEVCLSSTSYDLHQKRELYQSAGVKEYVAVVLSATEVRWQRLVADEYQDLSVAPDGIIRSVVFPGLWLDAAALLEGNTLRIIETLKRGLDSAEHAEFVEHLRSQAAKGQV